MKYDLDLQFKIQHIYNDLDLLDAGHFNENDPVPGSPSYHTLTKRIRENLEYIIKKLESEEDS